MFSANISSINSDFEKDDCSLIKLDDVSDRFGMDFTNSSATKIKFDDDLECFTHDKLNFEQNSNDTRSELSISISSPSFYLNHKKNRKERNNFPDLNFESVSDFFNSDNQTECTCNHECVYKDDKIQMFKNQIIRIERLQKEIKNYREIIEEYEDEIDKKVNLITNLKKQCKEFEKQSIQDKKTIDFLKYQLEGIQANDSPNNPTEQKTNLNDELLRDAKILLLKIKELYEENQLLTTEFDSLKYENRILRIDNKDYQMRITELNNIRHAENCINPVIKTSTPCPIQERNNNVKSLMEEFEEYERSNLTSLVIQDINSFQQDSKLEQKMKMIYDESMPSMIDSSLIKTFTIISPEFKEISSSDAKIKDSFHDINNNPNIEINIKFIEQFHQFLNKLFQSKNFRLKRSSRLVLLYSMLFYFLLLMINTNKLFGIIIFENKFGYSLEEVFYDISEHFLTYNPGKPMI